MTTPPQEKEPPRLPARSRSVNDFGTTEELFQAMTSPPAPVTAPSSPRTSPPPPDQLRDDWDWVLTNYDVGTTEPQSIREELLRLQVLKSYVILDKEREASFDRLTSLAARQFNVSIALVSLVDLGRQWFMSSQGLGDVKETPRNMAFCAHAIQGHNALLVVKDTHEDPRFCNAALVTGPPFIRFYAGAPLLSPEGYKLGTLCIIDDKPRPNGLTCTEEALLLDLAAITVQTMVDRRAITSQHDMSQLVACTAHDLLTPLMGVQLSLSLLQDDPDFQRHLSSAQQETFAHGLRSAEWLHRICQNTMTTLRSQASTSPYTMDGRMAKHDDKNNCSNIDNDNKYQHSGEEAGDANDIGGSTRSEPVFGMPRLIPSSISPSALAADDDGGGMNTSDDSNPFIDMATFLNTLNATVEPIPKRVPLIVNVEDSVPTKIISDELKLFRSSLNLLSSAFSRTDVGSVQFRIFVQEPDTQNSNQEARTGTRELSQLVFECVDTGKDCRSSMGLACDDDDGGDNRTHAHIFKPGVGAVPNLALSSVAYQIESLGGRYGYHPRREESNNGTATSSGSTFWFSVPLVVPKDLSTFMFSPPLAKEMRQMSPVSRALSADPSAFESSGSRQSSRQRGSLPENLLQKAISAGSTKGSVSMPPKSPKQPGRIARQHRASLGTARQSGILAVAAAAAAAAPPSSCIECVSPKKSPSLQDFRRVLSSPSSQVQWKDNKRRISQNMKPCISTGSITHTATQVFSDSLTGALNGNAQRVLLSASSPRGSSGMTPGGMQNATWPRAPMALDSKETLPVANKNGKMTAAVISSEATKMEPTTRPKKALVIEDTLVVRKTLTRALQRHGYEVTQANDGLEGLHELKKTIFDFVLCDFLMPNMDGLDCVQQYRQWEKANRSSSPPQYIVGISAHVSGKDVEKGLEIGMNKFQAKPITLSYLKELDESEELKSRRKMLDEVFRNEHNLPTNRSDHASQIEYVADVTNTHPSPTAQSPTNGFRPTSYFLQAASSTDNPQIFNQLQNDDNTSPARTDASAQGSPTSGRKVCLMATTALTDAPAETVSRMKKAGWVVTLVDDGDRALQHLKMRNWDAVILCDELPGLTGHQCVGKFRDWERANRVNRQENVILVCTQISLPTGLDAVMHPPAGFDGALDCHMEWGNLESLLLRNKNPLASVDGGMRIVIR